MRGISKHFGSVEANKNVNLTIKSGEIVGLLGENGAGKTTLMNILYGLYQPDSGEILIDGSPVSIRSPRDSMELGIGMVHQHFMLIQNHTVAENMVLGYKESPAVFPQKSIKKTIKDFAKKYGFAVDPENMVWQLSAGQQQRVEIVKTLLLGADLLILDEPTSVLTPPEVRELFSILNSLKKEGHGIILISHKLEEIMEICDRAVVLRKGIMEGDTPISSVTKEELAKMMVGREVIFNFTRKEVKQGRKILEVEDLYVTGDRGETAVSGVSFSVREGEIFGIAGVSGNGQKELAEAITGLRKCESGKVIIEEEIVTNTNARKIHDRGITHVPEERIKFGIVPNLFLYDNAVLKQHHRTPFSNFLFLDYPVIHEYAKDLVLDYQVSTPSIFSQMKALSGGNIQKLILGREISGKPKLLVAAHPTYGLDVGATEYIRNQLLKLREEGSAVFLISEDLEEIYELCDRTAVMFSGAFMGIVKPEKTGIEEMGLMMAGSLHKTAEADQ